MICVYIYIYHRYFYISPVKFHEIPRPPMKPTKTSILRLGREPGLQLVCFTYSPRNPTVLCGEWTTWDWKNGDVNTQTWEHEGNGLHAGFSNMVEEGNVHTSSFHHLEGVAFFANHQKPWGFVEDETTSLGHTTGMGLFIERAELGGVASGRRTWLAGKLPIYRWCSDENLHLERISHYLLKAHLLGTEKSLN